MQYITLKISKEDARLVNARQEMYDALLDCAGAFAQLTSHAQIEHFCNKMQDKVQAALRAAGHYDSPSTP